LKIFFDIDGVIIDGWSSPDRRIRWDVTMEQDLGICPEVFQKAFFAPQRPGTASMMDACVKGEANLKHVLSELLPSLGYRGSIDAFVDYWFSKDSNINQDVLEIVKRLKEVDGVTLYLATTQEHFRAAYLWHELGLKDLFAAIFYSASLGVTKSEPSYYTIVNAKIDIQPSERPLFFDDMPTVITAARTAGWDAHVFNTVEDLLQNPRIAGVLDGRVGCI